MKIYGFPRSRASRATWTAEEAGVEYEYVRLNAQAGEHRQAPYLQINPNGKVPALVDGDLVLSESGVICTYLAERSRGAQIIPSAGTPDRYRHDQWLFFVIGELEQPLWTMGKHRFALPAEHRKPEIMETAGYEFKVAAEVLAKGLGDSQYILGDQFTVADIMIGHTLRWANAFGVPVTHDNVNAYAERVWTRPALARAFAREDGTSSAS
ncbi:MAG: glutathione S-transferase family protein [Myxococcales bacterium]|nr:glutathione S-transferase family protein [Myxococcales bacterium]